LNGYTLPGGRLDEANPGFDAGIGYSDYSRWFEGAEKDSSSQRDFGKIKNVQAVENDHVIMSAFTFSSSFIVFKRSNAFCFFDCPFDPVPTT
jgi:hypothetical protein